MWSGGTLANGTANPLKWDYSSGKTWGYMAGGAVIGDLSGGAANAVATSGIPFANTAAIATGSFVKPGLLLLSVPGVNGNQPCNIFKVFGVACNQHKVVNESGSCNDSVREFYFMLFADINGFKFYRPFQFYHQGIIDKAVQHFQILFGSGFPAQEFNLRNGRIQGCASVNKSSMNFSARGGNCCCK